MANAKGSHQAKHRIADERKLPRDAREQAEDLESKRLRQRMFEGIARTKAILGHIRASNWIKQGKRDAR